MKKIIYIFTIFVFLSAQATKAFACEMGPNATAVFSSLITEKDRLIDQFSQEVPNFFNLDFDTAQTETITRLDEFNLNVRTGLENMWFDGFRPNFEPMTRQLSVAEVDQTLAIGNFIDANAFNDMNRIFQENRYRSHRGYRPSELACQADTSSYAINNADRFSRHIGKTIATISIDRLQNKRDAGTNTLAAGGVDIETQDGPLAEHNQLWAEYLTYFCDPIMNAGNSGCSNPGVPGLLPNRDLFLGDLLWGDQKTLDLSVAENRIMVDRMLRNIIQPTSLPILVDGVLETDPGRKLMLQRRSYYARQQAIYNVLGKMIGLRAATDPDIADNIANNIGDIRTKAGILPINVSGEPSYYEMMETMTRDKYRHKDYATNLIEEPENLIREGINIQTFQLQQMNDIYKRNEELLLLMAADLSFDLDSIPMPNIAR